MAEKKGSDPGARQQQSREDRLKAALKANLARRKAQNRLRAKADEAHPGPGRTGQEEDR